MASGPTTILYPVTDLDAAKSIFTTLLGMEPMADDPYYVGYQNGDHHVGLVPNGAQSQGMTGPIAYYGVDDIEAAIASLEDAGAEVVMEPRTVGGGNLVASLKDADGNQVGLSQAARQGE